MAFIAGVKHVKGEFYGEKLILLSEAPKKQEKKRCAICTKQAVKNGVCSAEHYKIWKENGFTKVER